MGHKELDIYLGGAGMTVGSIFAPEIRMYKSIVLKDPKKKYDWEYNTYGELRYDRGERRPLTEEEKWKIEPITNHMSNIIANGEP